MQEYKDFQVDWCEQKLTKTGKPYLKATINDEGRKTDVNIFSDWPDFANIHPGSVIRGKLEQKGQYWNIVSETQDKPRKTAYKPIQSEIKEAQDTKRRDINNSQDRKEESIKLASAQRDAVLIATTLFNLGHKPENESDVKLEIIKWRNWFLTDFPKDIPPF